jgi:MFS family permease
MLGLERNGRLILISQFIVGISYGLFFFILPVHIRALGASPTEVGITLSAAGLSTLLVVLPFGYLADRSDPRKLMLITKAFPVIPIGLLAVASQWEIVMVLLFIIYFEGAVVTVFNSYLTRILDADVLQRTFSTVGVGYLLGELLFRSVGAWIAEEAGIDIVFYLAAIVFAISAIPIALIKVDPGPKESVKVDYRPLFKGGRFLAILAFIFAMLFVMEVGIVLVPNYLTEVAALELSTIGQLGSLATLGGVVLSLTLGRLKGNRGLISVLFSMIASMGLLISFPDGGVLAAGTFLMGSIHAANPILEALMGRTVPVHLSGMAFGLNELMFGIAILLGPIVAGVLYETSPKLPMSFTIGGLFVLALLTLLISRNSSRSPAT